MTTQIIAHRGASYLANHENTIEAYQIALDIHTDCIEFDVRQTLDKVLVLFHDEQLNGVSIKALTYHQLCVQSEALGYHIPTLEETLKLCQKKVHLLVELKEAGYEKRVLSLLQTYFSYEEYSVQSFLDIVVRRVKHIDPQVHTGLLLGVEHADLSVRFNEFFPARRLRECMADFASVHYRIATPDFLFRMKGIGFPVYVWTVDDPRMITRFLEDEADGIITNRPDVGLYLRTRHEREKEQSDERKKRTYNLVKHGFRKLTSKKSKQKIDSQSNN